MMIKEIIAKAILLGTGLFIPIHMYIIGIFILVGLDLVTGMIKNNQLNEYELKGNWFQRRIMWIRKITSRGLRRTFVKFTAYCIGMIAVSVLHEVFLSQIMNWNITILAGIYIATTEVASIMENLSKITRKTVFTQIYNIIKTKINDTKPVYKNITNEMVEDEDEYTEEEINKKDKNI